MTNVNFRDSLNGVGKILYRGVLAQKFPFDYIMYQMIIHEIRPDLIIEIGTMHGGAALYYADLQETFGIEGGEVHTIDLISPNDRKQHDDSTGDIYNPYENPNYPDVLADHPRIKIFDKGYQGYDLSNCEGFKKILVIDDGSHIYEDVYNVMEKFKDLITIGSYLIIEDGNCEEVCNNRPDLIEMWKGGPLRATKQFIAENDNFRVDYRWCDMFGINATYNTYGYLKKIK